MPSSAADPAMLLYEARMQAGLTQGEMAQRAGVTRQMVGAYESGQRQPSVKSLEKLVAGCGMRLEFSLVLEPGLEDAPTRALLDLPPLLRLSDSQQDAITSIAEVGPTSDQLLLGGKAAARLYGAVVAVRELELLVNGERDVAEIEALLTSAGVEYLNRDGMREPICLTKVRLFRHCDLVLGPVKLRVRTPDHYAGMQERAGSIDLLTELPLPIVCMGECSVAWYPRDVDHLALHRARRVARGLLSYE